MSNWNQVFTQLIRASRNTHWGNWALNASIAPGAVGIVDPESGTFTLAKGQLPNAQIDRHQTSSKWQLSSSNVSRHTATVDLDGSVTDYETGTTVSGEFQIAWGFDKAGSLVSEFALAGEDVLVNPGEKLAAVMPWMRAAAQQSGMGDGTAISQGFGVITSVIYANAGLNVGAESDGTTFSIGGAASGVNKMIGEANGKGSYKYVNSNKTVDLHLWPVSSESVAPSPIPIAYTFASFEGDLLIPNWTGHVGALQLVIDNSFGGTYIVKCTLIYHDGASGRAVTQEASISGGLSRHFSLPPSAQNVSLEMAFKGVFSDDEHYLHWDTPLAAWDHGIRHVDLYGVWPGATSALDREGSPR